MSKGDSIKLTNGFLYRSNPVHKPVIEYYLQCGNKSDFIRSAILHYYYNVIAPLQDGKQIQFSEISSSVIEKRVSKADIDDSYFDPKVDHVEDVILPLENEIKEVEKSPEELAAEMEAALSGF